MANNSLGKIKTGFEWIEHGYFLVQLLAALGLGRALNGLISTYLSIPVIWRDPIWLLSSAALLFVFIRLGKWVGGASKIRTPPTPIARTRVSEKWLYTPLKQIYRTNFHDQEVRLDGYIFIDCTFGKGVILVFSGLAPFKIEPFTRTGEFKWAFRTDNLAIQHLLRFLQDSGKIVGQIQNDPPPIA
jgi:hypothetical protein